MTIEFSHFCFYLTRGAILSTLANFDFLQKTFFFKAFCFFSLYFFPSERQGSIVYKVGKGFAYPWIITLVEAELEKGIVFSPAEGDRMSFLSDFFYFILFYFL